MTKKSDVKASPFDLFRTRNLWNDPIRQQGMLASNVSPPYTILFLVDVTIDFETMIDTIDHEMPSQ